MGNPISFRFPSPVQINHTDYGSIRCISLGKSFEITNMTSPNVCSSREQGRFSLGVPTSRNNHRKEGNDGFWGWWVVRIASVSVVLVILGFLLLSIHRLMARKRIKEMEKRSDQGVPLDTFYIGRSKMQSASMIRTQPMTVENEYIS
ncbi:hypothetical protein SAY87_012775 [Trapa incisa]|uniref:Uncharacterized protein n=1 Tax=Trapa incisa TaxID=236973 RepID=A0AAN7GTI0_9MYRT|nr:hypothetical protein SAY87_012775 [Trapa incisa]